ncbi:large ribosomal subunit protein eL33y isoform X1 [Nicotiana tabacum]|uniref:Large ribosomal subunit protein eL33y isoform X1 n=1 Tax=Nicotiana tabacum TaxID=4097 RepID=A0AC58SA11_TOBAC
MVKGRQGERVRLYVRGTVLGYKRSKSNQYPSTSLIQIEGVNTKEEVDWYLGKRMAYIYKAKTKKNNSHYRCIWGKVCRPHGNSGVVRAKFKSNLPPKSMVHFIFSPNLIQGIVSLTSLEALRLSDQRSFSDQEFESFLSSWT